MNPATLAAAALFAALRAYAQFNVPGPDFPLMAAVISGDAAAVEKLLKGGADPNKGNKGSFMGIPPLSAAFMWPNAAVLRALLDAKADIEIRDSRGATPLMWSVYHDNSDPQLARMLLAAGASPNAVDANGDSALIHAMRRGNVEAVRVLEQGGASRDRAIRKSAERAIALLQKSSPQFTRVSGCVSCHHQTLPAMAMEAAREHGIAFDEQAAAKDVEATVAMWKLGRQLMRAEPFKIPDPPVVVSYALVGLAAANHPDGEDTAEMARFLGAGQQQDGSWRVMTHRAPLEAFDITATALSIRAMSLYGNDAAPVERAAVWLAGQTARTSEERSMQLLGLAWAKRTGGTARLVRELLAKQLPGGGWAQLDVPEADAYATGQALAALHAAGGLRPGDAAWKRAVDYLLRTQLKDGSWLVVSRSHPFQPYKESGFPHGKDQWISASGTSWAALALSLSAGEPVSRAR